MEREEAESGKIRKGSQEISFPPSLVMRSRDTGGIDTRRGNNSRIAEVRV
jgi:hypothetical protein